MSKQDMTTGQLGSEIVNATVTHRDGNTVTIKLPESRAISGEITLKKYEGGTGIWDPALHSVGDFLIVEVRSPHLPGQG